MKKQFYRTSNFYLSAYLICRGLELVSLVRDDPKRAAFVFTDSAEREEMVNQYNFGKEALVDARRFVAATKELKYKLYT